MKSKALTNQKGQGLIEYLILVALMGVATISVVRVIQQNVGAKFSTIAEALQGNRKTFEMEKIQEQHYKKKDMGDFMNGVASKK